VYGYEQNPSRGVGGVAHTRSDLKVPLALHPKPLIRGIG